MVRSLKSKDYNKILVIGPEGSGTNLLTDIASKLRGWPRRDPIPKEFLAPATLERECVHHVSLPSHRPAVWFDFADPSVQDFLILGILRDERNSVYSAWSRFRHMPMIPGAKSTLHDYIMAYRTAIQITRKHAHFYYSYVGLCKVPKVVIRDHLRHIGLGGGNSIDTVMDKLGIDFVSHNGRYEKDTQFMQLLGEAEAWRPPIYHTEP